MSHFSDWFNYQASLKILLFSMLAGAALPGLFALGLRFHAVGAGQASTDGSSSQKNPALLVLAWAIYAVVLLAIAFALAYISRDFIAHHTGTAFLGAKPK
ncbi:hypothetical protein A5697_23835 [Mycobacterium sp. E3251]|uniref:hypothetical protein n=1 Tax=unclassified Mycobacterium TaxID=2642494 RepID=UPI0007FD5841|nr:MULTISPECIES: hypothetical protein [unclassified Mycobacterium]OBG95632.1 hypothetical protein A5697_23835 [Mycobacterium sp. E3251]OBI25148.1 hypothetical protein A5711_06485 [Mycobacterium sp. E2238]OBI37230.1 hypothetical protein A5709_14950 [Mycobacterium sp. E1386]